MSDFLQHLLERAQGQGPQLVRRKPSLYEPRSFEPEGVPEETRESQRASLAPPAADSQEPDAPSSPPLRPRDSADAGLPSRHARPEPANAFDSPRRAAPVAEPAESVLRASMPDPAPALRIESHHTETIRERSETRVIERRESVRESVVDRQAVVEHVGTVIREPAPVPPVDSTVRLQPRTPSAERPGSRPAPYPNSPAMAQPNIGRARAARAAAQPPNQDAPPQVTISIGRLEIRPPAHQPPPSRPNRTKMPQLSLDDYLRTRTGGTR